MTSEREPAHEFYGMGPRLAPGREVLIMDGRGRRTLALIAAVTLLCAPVEPQWPRLPTIKAPPEPWQDPAIARRAARLARRGRTIAQIMGAA